MFYVLNLGARKARLEVTKSQLEPALIPKREGLEAPAFFHQQLAGAPCLNSGEKKEGREERLSWDKL